MTMVLVPSVSGGDLCLNPDAAAWILPNDPDETCQVLMADNTVYNVALGVRAMKEIFADSFIQLTLAKPMPSKPSFVLVSPFVASSIEANDAQTSYVIAGEKQLVNGTVEDLSTLFNSAGKKP